MRQDIDALDVADIFICTDRVFIVWLEEITLMDVKVQDIADWEN